MKMTVEQFYKKIGIVAIDQLDENAKKYLYMQRLRIELSPRIYFI
jgi:hypothetical protein